MEKLDKEQIEKIVEKSEKLTSSEIVDKKKVAELNKEIDQLLNAKKYFQRLI